MSWSKMSRGSTTRAAAKTGTGALRSGAAAIWGGGSTGEAGGTTQGTLKTRRSLGTTTEAGAAGELTNTCAGVAVADRKSCRD